MRGKEKHIYSPHRFVNQDGTPNLDAIFKSPLLIKDVKSKEDIPEIGKRHLKDNLWQQRHLLSLEGYQLVQRHLERCQRCREKVEELKEPEQGDLF